MTDSGSESSRVAGGAQPVDDPVFDANDELQKAIEQVEGKAKFTEWSVVGHIDPVRRNCKEAKVPIPVEVEAEYLAFSLMQPVTSEDHDWRTYYGPIQSWLDGEGVRQFFPSREQVTAAVVAHWESRSDVTSNLLLKVRYSDLVWEFKRQVTGESPEIKYAQQTIDGIIGLATNDGFRDYTELESKLERALSLAVKVNDEERIAQLVALISEVADQQVPKYECRAWEFAFNSLVLNRKVDLSAEQTNRVIEGLNNQLASYCEKEDPAENHPWSGKRVAFQLAGHYRRSNQLHESQRVIQIWAQSLIGKLDSFSSAQGKIWLREIYDTYQKYELFVAAGDVLVQIEEVAAKIPDELHSVRQEYQLSNKAVAEFIGRVEGGTLPELVSAFLVDPAKEEEILKRTKNGSILPSFGKQTVDGTGRTLAAIGPLELDLGGNVIHAMSNRMMMETGLLNKALTQKIDDPSSAISFIYASIGIEEDRIALIERAVKAFFEEDFSVAIHLMIPQIENGLRTILNKLGRPTFKPHRNNGGMVLRNVDEILRDRELTSYLGELVTQNLRVLLSDQRGLNFRNDVSHGIPCAAALNWLVATRVLHGLMILGLYTDIPDRDGTDD